jgi:hypothetical protein
MEGFGVLGQTAIVRETARMVEQPADGDVTRKGEAGQFNEGLADGIIQAQDPVFDQGKDDRREKRLGDTVEQDWIIWVQGRVPLRIAVADGALPENPAVPDDRPRCARNAGPGEQRTKVIGDGNVRSGTSSHGDNLVDGWRCGGW